MAMITSEVEATFNNHPLVKANQARNLILTDDRHVFFFPQGWAEEYFDIMLENYEDSNPEDAVFEMYGYAPLWLHDNSEVDTMWVTMSDCESMREISEEDARELHPELFAHMEKLNNGL